MRTCAHEASVLAATRAMPARPMPDALLAHMAECDDCRELHVVASVLRADRDDAVAHARIPSAGQVWWRAELRARHDAAAAATRPITVVSGLAAACLVGLLASLAGVLAVWLQQAVGAWPALSASRLAVWFALAAVVVATPLVLLFVLREE